MTPSKFVTLFMDQVSYFTKYIWWLNLIHNRNRKENIGNYINKMKGLVGSTSNSAQPTSTTPSFCCYREAGSRGRHPPAMAAPCHVPAIPRLPWSIRPTPAPSGRTLAHFPSSPRAAVFSTPRTRTYPSLLMFSLSSGAMCRKTLVLRREAQKH